MSSCNFIVILVYTGLAKTPLGTRRGSFAFATGLPEGLRAAREPIEVLALVVVHALEVLLLSTGLTC